MKLKINKACDLSSISVLPPRRTGGSGGGGMGALASAVSGASQLRSQTQTQSQSQMRSQTPTQSQLSFSHSQSQLSQTTLDDNLLTLHLPSPGPDQRFSLHDDLSKRVPLLPASSTSCAREESQLQLSKVSSKPLHRWNTSLPDSRYQVANEELEHKFQHLSSSVHKMGMVLDSVQNDVMQLNRAMKEASLDSGSMRQKVLLLDSSVQQILKGQDDLKALLEGSMKSYPDHLSALNSTSSKLNEISSALSGWPEQMQADLRKLQSDIFRIFSKEMEGIVRAIRSLNSRPAALEMAADRGHMTNEGPLRNQIPVTKVNPAPRAAPLAYSRKVADPKPKVEDGKVKVFQQKLTGSSFKLPPKQEQVIIRKAQNISITIDSDDDSEGRASCVILKTETANMESHLMKEAREESLQILRRARKRKRREMNSVVIC